MKFLLILPITVLIILTYYTYNKLFYVEKNNIQNIEIIEVANIPEEIMEKIKLQDKLDLEKKESPIIPFSKEDELNENKFKLKNKKLIDVNVIIGEGNINSEEIDSEYSDFINNSDLETLDISILKLNYSSNIDNVLKFSGKDIELIEYIELGGKKYKAQIIDSNIFILIKENNLLNGEYTLIFHSKSGNIIELSDKITFRYEDGNTIITDITPNIITNDSNKNIVLQGKGFKEIISIQLSNNVVLKETSFNIITDNVMSVLVPKDITKGKYTLNLMSVDGIYKSNYEFKIFNK